MTTLRERAHAQKWDGIAHAGEPAEALFCRLTGARATTKKASADAVLEGIEVEVKEASGGTVCQVRPIRGMPIVVWANGIWYVVPVRKLVDIATTLPRGQHTESAIECMAFPIGAIAECVCPETYLHDAVLRAVPSPQERRELAECLVQMRSLVDTQRERLRTAFGLETQLGLGGLR